MPLSKFFSEVAENATDAALTESNHRIANNLALISSLVRLQASDVAKGAETLTRNEVSLLLREIAVQVEAVGRLHRLLSSADDATDVDCGDYLKSLCDCTPAALGNARTNITYEFGADCRLPAHQVVPVGLIVTEVVMNALKYAHPAKVQGEVRVSCRRDTDGSLKVEVADNGVGLPEPFDPTKDGGTGFRIVRALAKQLNATPLFETNELGLTVHLRVPPLPN